MSLLQECIENHRVVLKQILHKAIAHFKKKGEIYKAEIKASKAMGGGILGIDMMEDEERGIVVHEVNNTVEFKGLAKVAKKKHTKRNGRVCFRLC